MAENITRCPKCSTSFRISEAHLKTAKGSVRCGSCLTVFNAKENLIATPQPEPEAEPEINDEEDLLISDTMEMSAAKPTLGGAFSESFNDLFGRGNDQDFNLFERESLTEEEDDDVPHDESWALDLLNDDSDTEDQNEEEDEDEPDADSPSEYRHSFQIIDETPTPDTSTQEAAKALFNQYDDVDIEEISYTQDNTGHTYAQSGTHPINTDYLSSIEPEPVEFDWHDGQEWWHSKALWGALSIVAAMVLFAQLAWINFSSFSVVEPYRSYYTKACNIFDCQLPALIDRDKIRSANLVVRSHPDIPNALIVDAIIQNTAKFEQTFPTMDLVFTDKHDKIVAARRLEPSDYLAGELAGRHTMPVRQPVHIAVEIADPGENATGYRIVIVR